LNNQTKGIKPMCRHLNDITCPYCKTEIEARESFNHRHTDDSRKILCPSCDEILLIKQEVIVTYSVEKLSDISS